MSWWPLIDSPDDFIGDPGADAVEGQLLHLATTSAEKPTLAEVVRALGDALGTNVEVAEVDAAASAPPDVAAAVERVLRDLDAVYMREFERGPRVAEVLETFTFSFSVPEPLVSGPRPARIRFTADG